MKQRKVAGVTSNKSGNTPVVICRRWEVCPSFPGIWQIQDTCLLSASVEYKTVANNYL